MAGYLKRQRVIAAQFIGRPLRRDEQVHHIDGNKRNNSRENLVVMNTREHQRLHKMGRRTPPEVVAKISAALSGRPKSPEHIRKVAQANRGKIIPAETRERIRASLIGRKQSEDRKARQKITMQKWWDRRRGVTHGR